jgi:hypothetical protein
MDRIKELEREIELTKELIELRKQLLAPVEPVVPFVPNTSPWTPTWIGDPPFPYPTITVCSTPKNLEITSMFHA